MTTANGTSNGHAAGEPLRARVRDLREQLRAERLRTEITRLQADAFARNWALRESYNGYTGSAWGDLVDPMDAFRDAALDRGFPFLDRGYARRDGANRPFLWSDFDLDLQRSTARYVWTKNRLAQGVVNTICNYTTRTGFAYEAQPLRHADPATAARVAARVNAFVHVYHRTCLDGSMEADRWCQYERSTVLRGVRDGEACLRHFPQPGGLTWVRWVEPEQIYQPLGSPPEWSWGVHTDPEDVARTIGYAVRYHNADDWDEVPAADVAFLKRNTDECVKRGLSDFYCTGEALDGTAKLLRNMLVSGGVQAAIAWIEQFSQANAATVGTLVNQRRDQGRPNNPQPFTGQVPNFTHYEAGSIPRVGAGREYVAAPQAVGASVHIQIAQAAMRSAGVRWGMPEYMVSGDSSNANYASTLVSGSPFVTAVECEQSLCFAPFFLRSHWIALKNWCDAGRLVVDGRAFTFEEVQQLVEIHATAPTVSVANKREEADIDGQDIANGVMSIQTRRAKRGLDDDKERQNLKDEPPTRVQGRVTDLDAQGNPTGAGRAAPPGGGKPPGGPPAFFPRPAGGR